MNDTMEVWQLCPHKETRPHAYAGGFEMKEPCPGGKRIVLRRVVKRESGEQVEYWRVTPKSDPKRGRLRRDAYLPFSGKVGDAGEVVYLFAGPTYGVIEPNAIAVSRQPNQNPFFQVDADNVEWEVNNDE